MKISFEELQERARLVAVDVQGLEVEDAQIVVLKALSSVYSLGQHEMLDALENSLLHQEHH